MHAYEYKVLPAPNKGRKGRGVRGGEARFAHALELLMNELAVTGWQYQRSDMLPHEERQGIRSSQTTYRSVLVFRRAVVSEAVDEPAAVEPSAEEATYYAPTEDLEDTTAPASNDPFDRLRQYDAEYNADDAPDDDQSPGRSD